MPSVKHSASENIQVARESIDSAMRDFLDAKKASFAAQRIDSALYEDMAEFACRPGKRIRPLLFLAGCELFGPRLSIPQVSLMKVAVSLELLHAFILIHDDIIDQSELRRNLPTLHKALGGRVSAYTDRERAGHDLALVMGDVLFALAQLAIVESDLPPATQSRLLRKLLGYIIQTGFGETADIVYGLRDISKVGLGEIEQMYLGKTTRYTFEAPLAMAAIVTDCLASLQNAIAPIVEPAGLAFQILNDLQEFEQFEVADIASSDILEGKKTVLMQTAFSRLSDPDRSLLQMCLSGAPGREAAATKLRELVLRSGAIEILHQETEALFTESSRRIDEAGLPLESANGLKRLFLTVAELIGAPRKRQAA